jgi:curved DNA-binding protein CbpA
MNLAKIHHPDYGGKVEKFQKINEAYKYSKKVLLRGKEIVDVKLETEAVLSG